MCDGFSKDKTQPDAKDEPFSSRRKSQGSKYSERRLLISSTSCNSETSPTKKFFGFLPLIPSFKRKSTRSSSDNSSPRPVLSSQCTGKLVESDISPVKPPKGFFVVPQLPPPFPDSGDGRFDVGSLEEDKIIPSFLSSRTCYSSMPKSGKIIVLSTELLVKNAFSCLVTNEIRAAPLWESATQTFVGMLTITDFINVLRHYYYSSPEDIKSIENQTIATWRKITNVSKPIVKILPNDSLVNAAKLLLQERIHRIPIYDDKQNSVLFVMTRRRLLHYLQKNLLETVGWCKKVPSFMKKTIADLQSQIGTWNNIATVSVNTKVIEALDLFCERNVSALPVIDENYKISDMFAKFDVFALAKEQTYDNLDMTVAEALEKTEVHEDIYGCSLEDSLGYVIEKFVSAKVHRLVVIDDKNKLIGMISLSDVLKFLILQPAEESFIVSDIIDESPEGAIGGIEDSSVFLDSGAKVTDRLQPSSSFEKQDSLDVSEGSLMTLSKLQLNEDTPDPLSDVSACEGDP